MPLFAHEHQLRWRVDRFVCDDGKKDLTEQLDRKAGDGCNELDDAPIFLSLFERVIPKVTTCENTISIEAG